MNKFLLVAILVFLAGCGPSQQEYDEARKKVMELEAQVVVLRADLEDVKFGSGRLLAQAKLAYDAQNDAEAKKILLDLLERVMNSGEIRCATSTYEQIALSKEAKISQ